MRNYTYTQTLDKTYDVTLEKDGEPYAFTVVVANDESEIDALVELHMRGVEQGPVQYVPTYKELRAAAYPDIPTQLDMIFHGGLEAWHAAIQAVKDKYPKPVE